MPGVSRESGSGKATGGMGAPLGPRLIRLGVTRSIVSITDQGVISATSFILNIYLARKLPVTDYGLFVVAYTVVYLVASVQNAMFGYPLLVEGSREEEGRPGHYPSSVLVLQWGFAATVASLIMLGLLVVRSAGWAEDVSALTVFTFFGLFYLCNQFVRRFLYLRDRVWMVLCVDTVLGVVLFGALFTYSAKGSLGLVTANTAMALSGGLSFCLGVFFLRDSISFKGLDLTGAARKNLKFGKWLLAQSICTWGTGQIYYLVSAAVLGMQAPALLKVCANLLAPLQVIFQGIDSIMTLAISRRLVSGRAKPFVLKTGAALVGFSALYCIVLPVFSEDLIGLLYGPAYGGLGYIVYIFALAFFFRSLAVVPNLTLISMKATKDTFIIHLVTLLISLAAMYPLLWYGRVAGAAVGTVLLPYFLWASFMLWRLFRVFPAYEASRAAGDPVLDQARGR